MTGAKIISERAVGVVSKIRSVRAEGIGSKMISEMTLTTQDLSIGCYW